MIPENFNRVEFKLHDQKQASVSLKHNQTDLVYQVLQTVKTVCPFDVVVFYRDGLEVSRITKNDILNYFKWRMLLDENAI